MGASSVISGTACAVYTGNFSLWPAVLCLIATLSSQLGFNLLRSYLVMKGAAMQDHKDVQQFQELPLSVVLIEAAKGCFLVSGMSFAGLLFMSGLWALLPAAAVALIGYLYLTTTRALYGSWWEQICQFFYFGPISVFSTFFYQALHNWGSFDMVMTDAGPAALTSILIGMLTVNASLVGICIADKHAPQLNREMFAIKYGTKGVSWVILVTGVVFYIIQWVQHFYYPINRGGLVMLALSISFVLNIVVGLGIRKDSDQRLHDMYSLAIMNPFIYSVLAMIVLIILREPGHGGFVIFD